MALAAMLQRFLFLLNLVDVKDYVAGVAPD
jgi:hypothetical protein